MIYFTSSVLLGELTRFKSISRQTGGRTRGGLGNSLSLSVGLLMAVFLWSLFTRMLVTFFFDSLGILVNVIESLGYAIFYWGI